MSTPTDHKIMGKDEKNIPYSALYTAATWRWGQLPCAELTTPQGAEGMFKAINAYMALYRLLNPRKNSLPCTLLHRHTIINTLLKRSGCRQLIEIAAGFSPRGSMVSADPALQYYEIDLPEVVGLKRNQLSLSPAGQAVLARPNYTLLAGDITALDFSQPFAAVSTFVITEGIMMYFKREMQMAIWRVIAQFIARVGGEYVFDYIPLDVEPQRSVLGKILSRIKTFIIQTESPFAYDQRTRHDVAADLRAAGFSSVEQIDSLEVARAWNLPHAEERTQVIIYCCRCNPAAA